MSFALRLSYSFHCYAIIRKHKKDMPKAKITKIFVDSAPYTKKGQILYCDTDLAGFYLMVGMRAKTYIAQKDVRGKSVRCTIGRHGHFTPDEARRIAKDKLYLMAQGINPDKLKARALFLSG